MRTDPVWGENKIMRWVITVPKETEEEWGNGEQIAIPPGWGCLWRNVKLNRTATFKEISFPSAKQSIGSEFIYS